MLTTKELFTVDFACWQKGGSVTPSQINIAIAECCSKDLRPIKTYKFNYGPATTEIESAGYLTEELANNSRLSLHYQGWNTTPVIEGIPKPVAIPNYCSDLNAMHEAERIMFLPEYGEGLKYSQCLRRITEDDKSCERWQWNATALQRAEAFLRVKGSWKE